MNYLLLFRSAEHKPLLGADINKHFIYIVYTLFIIRSLFIFCLPANHCLHFVYQPIIAYTKASLGPVIDKDMQTPHPPLSKRAVLNFMVEIVEKRSETNVKRI